MPAAIVLPDDLRAGAVVTLVALPLCLGVALASGAPLSSGLVAGIVGGLVVSLVSGSALMVSGPAAGLTAIVLAAITELGAFDAFLVAVVLAGLMQLVLAALRAGIIGYYFPSAVIKGMLAAIGVILVLKQLPHAVGWDKDAMGDETFAQADHENTFSALAVAAEKVQWGAVLIAALSLAVIWVWGRPMAKRLRAVPAPLVVVLAGVALNALFQQVAPALAIAPTHLVQLPMSFLTQLTSPDWSALSQPAVWRIAGTIAVVASLETLLSLEATDKMDPYKREAPTNRELLAQGVGNAVSGLFGGLPVTGVIVRSAANVDAGAKTRWSSFTHGALLLVAVLVLPVLLNTIPLASLAAILLATGYKLAHPKQFVSAYRSGWTQLIPFVVTIVAILLTDLLVGIGIGMAVGIFFILWDHLQTPPFAEVSPEGAVLRRVRLHDHVNFLHKASLVTLLDELPDGSRLEVDGRTTRRIDPDVLEILHNFTQTAALRSIDYRLVGVPPMPAGATAGH
jgi:MFS superfamily sulfate permease-like transporter